MPDNAEKLVDKYAERLSVYLALGGAGNAQAVDDARNALLAALRNAKPTEPSK